MTTRLAIVAAALTLLIPSAFAQYEYRFIEGESFARAESEGLRDEGFTSWMGHPSGGRLAIFGTPGGGFLEYGVADLAPGEYSLYVRCLALPMTKTHVLWDGQDLGLITHATASTTLAWSQPIKVTSTGDHTLRLQGSDDGAQWPYIDVILLTNAHGYQPPRQDQDFVSYQTVFPLLTLKRDPTETIAPLPPAEDEGPVAGLSILGAEMPSPAIGPTSLTVTLQSTTERTLELAAYHGWQVRYDPADARTVKLEPDAPQSVTLPFTIGDALRDEIGLLLREGQQHVLGLYRVPVPSPVAVTLDEYAYPSTQRAGLWTADFTCAPELLPKIEADLTLYDYHAGRDVFRRTLTATQKLELPFDLVGLPVGSFQFSARFMLGKDEIAYECNDFIKYNPVAWPAWEPVREAKAVGDTITLNGKPFLARMLYHAPMEETIRDHGFNVVQCFGSDPDPLPSIQRHLDACQAIGLYGAVALFNNQYFNKGTEFDLAHLEEAILRFKDHPALLCWDLIDEPEPTMEPAAVQAGADLIRRLDPDHFVWVNMCQYPRLTDYLASQDLWSYDYYPFPQQTPFVYKERWLNLTDEKLLGKLPLGTCLQTYNYNRHDLAMPTPDELRTSAWLHIIHGYKWLGYYSYNDGEPCGSLSNTPVLFSHTRALNTELVQLQDVILAPGQWKDIPIEPANKSLEAREKEVGGKLYVVVINDSRDIQKATLRPGWPEAKHRLLIEMEDKPSAGPLKVTLGPTCTQVWELTR